MTFQNRPPIKIVKSVLFALILREMRSMFSARRFGAFWMFFEPVMQIGLIMAIFSFRDVHLASGIEMPVFFMSGMVPFFLLRNIALKGMEAVNANRALFSYKQIKPIDTVLARAIMETALYACVFVIFMFILGFCFGYDVSIRDPLRWIVVIFVGVMFSFSLGLIFCIIGELFAESKVIIRMLFFPLYLLSGVIFPIWVFPAEVMDWLLWNPYLHIIDELRFAMFDYYPLHTGVNIMYPMRAAIFTLLLAMGLYRLRRFKLIAI
ncbi:permease of an ABC exporter involved in polysaccharide export [Advenella kashmirensis WT001]|uniref:Transport permease protein n=1 Tax=Advenella kashmirensis (strain DSM 17095 / LMG 22695 / WT001) TaxID=1036672 RepID=I3UGZ1_ADVKW|nr:ABC transporter permease [Advenella kashmirensis]AFK64279.1 permease of an ABC exporter involved in polysaccharide export [Advenella kashmirensis WT001]